MALHRVIGNLQQNPRIVAHAARPVTCPWLSPPPQRSRRRRWAGHFLAVDTAVALIAIFRPRASGLAQALEDLAHLPRRSAAHRRLEVDHRLRGKALRRSRSRSTHRCVPASTMSQTIQSTRWRGRYSRCRRPSGGRPARNTSGSPPSARCPRRSPASPGFTSSPGPAASAPRRGPRRAYPAPGACPIRCAG